MYLIPTPVLVLQPWNPYPEASLVKFENNSMNCGMYIVLVNGILSENATTYFLFSLFGITTKNHQPYSSARVSILTQVEFVDASTWI